MQRLGHQAARNALILARWHAGFLTEDIAEEVGCTPGNVGAVVSRARKARDPLVASRDLNSKKFAVAQGVCFGAPPRVNDNEIRRAMGRIERGEKNIDVAASLGISPSWLSTRISRIRAKEKAG